MVIGQLGRHLKTENIQVPYQRLQQTLNVTELHLSLSQF
jgi:hypothetical protein